jgi:predicted ribosome quality control (RQC) complex YloA/Tae2 family protein
MLSLCELRRASRLLDAALRGHRVQAIAQPDATSLVLTTWGAPGEDAEPRRQHLLLSCRPGSARVALLETGRESLPAPPAFTQRARALLLPSRVAGAALLGEDRVFSLALDGRDGRFELVLQILPQRSNLYLLNGENQCLLATLRPLSETRPELALQQPGRGAAPRPPSEGRDRFEAEPDERFLFAIESACAEAERAGELAGRRRAIEQALRREERGLVRKLEKIDQELAGAEAAARLEREGELLKGVLSRVRKGASEVVARDPATETDLVIALDPSLSPAENLDRIFKRYRKAVRALAQGATRREGVLAALETVHAKLRELESIQGLGEEAAASALTAFAAQSAVSGLLARRAPVSPNRRERPDAERELAGRRFPARLAPRRYRTAGDLEVWVGRSDAGNDFLTTRLARGRDLFFHLDGAPGSHVILRTEGRLDPPSEAVLDACELAVHFSKQRDATRADVHVVPIANVRKPRGAKPGLVTVHGGKTVHLRRTPGRLERVLAARIED